MASVGTSLVKTVVKTASRKLFLGKCYPCEIPKAQRVVVKHLEFDEWLKMYFANLESYYAHVGDAQCKSGDVVLIEELPKRMTRDITHQILKVVYPLGDVTDPISGRKCVRGEFRDDMDKKDELWGKNENAFDYNKAPPRGWQEGRKDWSHKRAHRKFHEFTDRDNTEAEW